MTYRKHRSLNGMSSMAAMASLVVPSLVVLPARADSEGVRSVFGITGVLLEPQIVAGFDPDSPDARVDPNLVGSPLAGVVSIFLSHNGISGSLCTGTLVGPDLVLTAGHCVDGGVNDGVSEFTPSEVTVFFNQSNWNGSPGTVPPPSASRTGAAIVVHPDFDGFNNPLNVINDDLALIRLASDAPAGVPVYPIYSGSLGVDQEILMVGYGQNGVGVTGVTVGGGFRLKRVGGNVVDDVFADDEGGLLAELYRWDFDAPTLEAGNAAMTKPFDHDSNPGTPNQSVPSYDYFGLGIDGWSGGPSLGNETEAGTGGGDSGGPAFLEVGGQLYLAGVHTFGLTLSSVQNSGAFGTGGGGIILGAYTDWLQDVGVIVPEASNVVSIIAAAGMIGGTAGWRRWRRAERA